MSDQSWYGQGNPCGVCRKPIPYLGAFVRATRDKPDGVFMCEACARRIDAATKEPWQLAQMHNLQTCTLCSVDLEPIHEFPAEAVRRDGKFVFVCPMCRADVLRITGELRGFEHVLDIREHVRESAAEQGESVAARTPAQTARARRLIDAWFLSPRSSLMSNPRRKTSRSGHARHLHRNAHEPSAPVIALFSGSHLDHGLLAEHWAFVQEIAREHLRERGLVPLIGTFHMPPDMTPLPNGLYGPASGDHPIDDEDVFYMSRGGRPWKDRLISAPKRPSHLMTVIAVPEFRPDRPQDGLVAFTACGGPMAPQNPDDPDNKDPEGARAFWEEHALAVDEKPMTTNRRRNSWP